jgi:hypothetical protein
MPAYARSLEAGHSCIHIRGGYRNVPETGKPIEDELRRRWLLAIEELGADAAFKDAAEAFALRFGCSLSEGETIALRAWRLLCLPGPPR